jgi:glycine/D-amino acid oxidase-like deaminating enzyme
VSGTPRPLSDPEEADVLVLGAGLAGLVVALELRRSGQKVIVLEASTVAAGASGAHHLGHVVSGLAIPYTRAVARYGHDDALAIWETLREGQRRLRGLLSELGDDCGYGGRGAFLLAGDREEAMALADSEDLLREDGFAGEFLDHYMLEARFDVRGFAGAYWSADDGELETTALGRALAGAAASRGVVLHEESPVLELGLDDRGVEAVAGHGRVRAPFVVIAGAASLVPALRSAFHARGVACLQGDHSGASLPSPARTVEGDLAWRISGQGVRVCQFAPDAARPDEAETDRWLGRHLVAPPRVRDRASGLMAEGPDRLPLVGLLPGLPAAVLGGLGPASVALAPLAARWVAEAVATGVDPTPPQYRAARVVRLSRRPNPQ